MQLKHRNFRAYITKADAEAGIVGAFVSVFGNIDYGWDVIVAGAFTKTIMERKDKIRVLDNHNSWSAMDAIGKILDIYEVGRDGLPPEIQTQYPDATGGLYVEIQFMLDDEISAGIFRRIKNGVIDEYSIGFQVIRQEYKTVNTDEGERGICFIQEIKLFEVSPVIFAMNDATSTVGAKGRLPKRQKEASPNPDDEPEAEPELDIVPNGKAKDPDETYAEFLRLADGDDMCKGCKFYGLVTDELGWCKMHEAKTAAGMTCDDYETTEKRLVGGDLKTAFLTWMQGQCSAFIELGAWNEQDKERLETMLDTFSDAFVAMLPKDMSEREIPVPATMTMPKHDDPISDAKGDKAEPNPNSDVPDSLTLARAEKMAEIIRNRMAKQPA